MTIVRLGDFPVKFGTSGARGPDTDLTPDYCWAFTAAFLQAVETGATDMLIGHDLRPSSPGIAAACMAAAQSRGVACRFAGAVPTPALALAAMRAGCPAIMVTGSHIPAGRNGLKAYRTQGEISKADERAMSEAAVDVPEKIVLHGLPSADPAIIEAYVDRYTSAFPPAALAGMRVGVYEHSAVARDLLHAVLRSLGAETVGLGRSGVFVPVDTEAIRPEEHALARSWAASGEFGAIVSADGDSDRPLLADETGMWLRGDILGLLCARALGVRSVVTPVSSTTAIELSGAFDTVTRTRIGSPHVIEGMAKAGLAPPVAGFEANGGFLLGSDAEAYGRRLSALPTRDAVLPVIAVLAEAKRLGKPVSKLAAELPRRFTWSGRLQDVLPETSRKFISRFAADLTFARHMLAPDAGEIIAVDRMDGFRASFENGCIVHLRASGNAPELRCYAEAGSEDDGKRLCHSCLQRIASRMNG